MQNSRLAITILLLLSFSCAAHAAALDPFRIGGGARSLAMGRCQTVQLGKLDSIFGNPANLAGVETPGLTSMQAKIAEDLNYTLINFAAPTRFGKIGLGYISSGLTGIPSTGKDANGRVFSNSSFDYLNSSAVIGFAGSPRPALALGADLKFHFRSFGSQSGGVASGHSLDLGALGRVNEKLTLGLALQNFLIANLNWGTGAVERFPQTLKLGGNLLVNPRLTCVAEAALFGDSPEELRVGVEWAANSFLFLRAGMERLPSAGSEFANNLTLGLGLERFGFSFDYAYYLDNTLSVNSTHYLSISYQVPKMEKKEEVKNPEPPKPVVLTKQQQAQIATVKQYIKVLQKRYLATKDPQEKKKLNNLIRQQHQKIKKIANPDLSSQKPPKAKKH